MAASDSPPLHTLAIHRRPPFAAGQGGDHPGAVGRVRARDIQDDLLDGVQAAPLAGRRALRAPVERLTADPATRATTAAGRPGATSSRDRATRTLTPSPARVPPR